jgi:hypothetical protein
LLVVDRDMLEVTIGLTLTLIARLGSFTGKAYNICRLHSARSSRQRPLSFATILLDSGLVPIDRVQKFLGYLNLSTTQIYAERSLRALGDNYLRALGGKQ